MGNDFITFRTVVIITAVFGEAGAEAVTEVGVIFLVKQSITGVGLVFITAQAVGAVLFALKIVIADMNTEFFRVIVVEYGTVDLPVDIAENIHILFGKIGN